MRSFVLALVAIALVSCQSKEPVVAAKTPPVQPEVPKAKQEPDTSPPPKPAVTAQTDKPKPAQDSKRNPSRINQLADLETTAITIGKHKLKAWIMDTDSKRAEGMMFLTSNEVEPDAAMLFVFPDEQERSFWMQNTYIPLDIAYIAKSGKIVSTSPMEPLNETGVPSKGKAMYALEMPGGAFKRLKITAGMTAKIDPKVKSK